MEFRELSRNHLHHAYVLVDKEGAHHDEVQAHFREILVDKNDRLSPIREVVFSIDHARKLKEFSSYVNTEKHVILISFDRISEAAQQALLKTLEEPAEGVSFVIIVRSSALLLPTILSRVQQISISSPLREDKSREQECLSFAKGTLTKRLTSLAQYIDAAKEKDEEKKGEARQQLIAFFSGLEEFCREQDIHNPKRSEGLDLVYAAKRDLQDIAPSVKMICEHISLRFPQF